MHILFLFFLGLQISEGSLVLSLATHSSRQNLVNILNSHRAIQLLVGHSVLLQLIHLLQLHWCALMPHNLEKVLEGLQHPIDFFLGIASDS